MRWTRPYRASPGLLALGLALCIGHGAAALDAQPLALALQDHNTATVVQFHPSDPTTVAELDRLAATSIADILAVCVGPGCTQGVTENIAHERGWPFKLAYDPRDTAEAPRGPAAANATRSPVRDAVANLRPSLPFPGANRAGTGLTATASAPEIPRLVSARGFLIIALPVLLLGLGGMAFFVGSRRRFDESVRDEDEDRDLEAFVRSRHGRKRPPVR